MSEVSARIARCGVSQEPRVGRSFLAPVILALDGSRGARLVVFLLLCMTPASAWSGDRVESTPNSALIEKLRALDGQRLGNYGIRNNCIKADRIRSMQFEDDKTAIIDMGRRRKVILTLRRECLGISKQGYIQRTRGNTLCAKFDRFEVLQSGIQCEIESLQPYVRLDNDKR